MYLKTLELLSRYLILSEGNRDDICRFLNFEIFSYLECRAVYVAQLSQDGCLQPIAHFGFTKGSVESWGAFPLTVDIPITAAVKQNSCIFIDSPDDLYTKFPAMKTVEKIDHDWNSIIAVPVHAFGVFSLTTYKAPKKDVEHERFLRTVGQLASVALTKCQLLEQINHRGKKLVSKTAKSYELTERQKVIRDLILKGMTNTQIANEIGFSDSLVRQETIAIYAALNVSGRKELLEAVK
jgi:transcriptional regulator with GAF, ATPase, and Fis domain